MNNNQTVNSNKTDVVILSEVEGPLPCPFCASTNIVFVHQIRGKAYVCGRCMAQTADTYCVQTQEDALKAWNMRKWVPEKKSKIPINVIEEMIKYMEESEYTIQQEWGLSMPLEQLIETGEMPELYYKLLKVK